MRDGIREKELSDLGIEATVEHVDKGRIRVECDLLAFDELVNVAGREDDFHDGYHQGQTDGRAAALAEVRSLAEAKAS